VTAVHVHRLSFAVVVTDAEARVVGRGAIHRVVVDADRFLARLGDPADR
jgi:hypothetical protein